jgi:hypothetical protein
MKLTQEFKQAFAAQYFTQKVAKVDGVKELQEVRRALWHELDNGVEFHIQLKPIESITDEQANKINPFFKTAKHFQKRVMAGLLSYDEVDKLRALGFATGFRGVPVDDMIDDGILKLEK